MIICNEIPFLFKSRIIKISPNFYFKTKKHDFKVYNFD